MAKQFEIYWFDYVNQDGTKKTRPILVLESSILLPIAEITSHKKRTNKDYEIIKWKEAGLPKKSVIRFDKIQFAIDSLLQSKIGDLQQEDIDKIKELKIIESLECNKLIANCFDKKQIKKYNKKEKEPYYMKNENIKVSRNRKVNEESKKKVITPEYTENGILICPKEWEDGWRD